jgi:hypothetical protein
MDLHDIKADMDRLVAELVSLGCDVRDLSHIRCPLKIHEDSHGSFSVFTHNDTARWKCHGCGQSGTIIDLLAIVNKQSPEDVCKKLAGANSAPQVRPQQGKKAPYVYKDAEALVTAITRRENENGYELAGQWTYNDAAGNPVMMTFRMNKTDDKTSKKFTQARKVDGGWVNRNEGICPIYRIPEVSKAEHVVVCEGERCADAMVKFGKEATTSPMGAGKAARADWSCLAGKKVTIWPDNDVVGKAHGETVAEILERIGCNVKIVDVESLNLPEGGDVIDLLKRLKADGMNAKQAREAIDVIVATAKPVVPAALSAFDGEMVSVKSGERACLETQWPVLDRETQAFMPRNILVVAGNPGASKSFLALQVIRHALKTVPVSALMLEDDRTFHIRRLLAQISSCSKLTENNWIEENREEYDRIREKHEDELKIISRSLHEAERGSIDVKGLLAWVEEHAKHSRLLVIDPISYMRRSKHGWLDDEEFLDGAHEIVKRSNTTLMLITHTTKQGMGKGPMDMSCICGGTGYMRKAQTVLFLSKMSDEHEVTIGCAAGRTKEHINRCVWVFKARNAPGYHMLGFKFDGQSLTWKEAGIIIKD